MQKYFHNLFIGVSVLPALLVMPARAEYTNISLDELYPDGTYLETLNYKTNQNVSWNAENIAITPTNNRAVTASTNSLFDATEPTILNLGGDNTKTITVSTHDDGILAFTKGVVNVKASDSISIKTDVADTGYAALWSQNSSDPGRTDTYATINLQANNIELEALGANGIVAMSEGRVNIKGDTTIKAKNAVLTRGYAETHINKDADYSLKMEGDIAFDYDEDTSKTNIDATVDVTLNGAQSYWNGNTVISYDKKPSEDKLQVNNATINLENGAIWNATKIVDNTADVDGRYYTALNNLNIDNGTVNIADTTRGITVENAEVADATFNGGPLNINNMSLTGGENTFNGNVAGVDDSSALVIGSDATMSIGTNTVNVHNITLDGNMFATLREGDDAQITASSFGGDGKLNLTTHKEGTYKVFGADTFDKEHVSMTNPVYKLSFLDDGFVKATKESVENIASNTGLANESAKAISHIADVVSTDTNVPVKLRLLSVNLQEKLIEADTNPDAKAEVEHATKAVHPETESVSQSVSTSVQNTIVNLASARMATPSVGRNGGDVKFTKGGVWVQGLFNKSKQGDLFNGYTRGVAAGLDGTINKHWTIGAGYSFAHSDISGTARDTKINSNTMFLYGQYKPSEWYINGIANYTISDYSENGTVIDSAVITSDYKSKSFGGAVNAGYDFASGITPELGLRYMHVSTDDYANSYGIKTHMDNTNFLTGVLGAKYAFNIAAGKHTTFAPQLNAGVKYDLASDKNVATITMPGVDSYTIEGSRLSRLGGEFGIGLGVNYHNLDLSVNYDIDVRDNYTSQTGMLKLRCNF